MVRVSHDYAKMSILLPICSACHICCIFNDLRFGYSEKETKQTTRLCGRDHFGWRQVQPRHANLRKLQVRSPKLLVRVARPVCGVADK
jgi:hypothetical protein